MIAVCLVHFNEKNLLDYGISLAERLNPDLNLTYFITENSPYKAKTRFTVEYVQGKPNGDPRQHHSDGLMRAIAQAKQYKPEFIILTEPDFIPTIPVQTIIDYMNGNNLDIVGTPYGKKGRQLDWSKHTQCLVTNVPTIHFLVARSTVQDFPLNLYSQQSKVFVPYTNKIGEVDTSIAFRQNLYRYRAEPFKLCLWTECSICREGGVHIDGRFKELAGKTEKLFLGNRMAGLHLQRYESDDLSLLKANVENAISNTFYHPLNNFL